MAATVTVRVVRPLHIGGRPHAAGATLKLSALDAAHAVGTGRAELVHAPDVALLLEAERDDAKRALKQCGKPWREPKVQAPWQRIA